LRAAPSATNFDPSFVLKKQTFEAYAVLFLFYAALGFAR
jgi:hypothetical protein